MPDLHVRLAAFLILIPFSLSHAAKSRPVTYRLAVEVAFGSNQGAESFREELELQLVRELQRAGCFRETTAASGAEQAGANLLLRALIHDTEQRTDYDISIAQRDSPHSAPATSRRMIARMEATIELRLLLLPENRTIREQRFGHEEAYRPQLNEDADYEVQLLMIERLARTGRKFACQDGGKKLEKEIERARAAP